MVRLAGLNIRRKALSCNQYVCIVYQYVCAGWHCVSLFLHFTAAKKRKVAGAISLCRMIQDDKDRGDFILETRLGI